VTGQETVPILLFAAACVVSGLGLRRARRNG
jgi:hypothetical protein